MVDVDIKIEIEKTLVDDNMRLRAALQEILDYEEATEYHAVEVAEKALSAGWQPVTLDTPNTPQPQPTTSNSPAIWDLVRTDIAERDATGEQKYGVRLQAFNGRDCLVDAYQEALDLVVYLRQAIYERDQINASR